MNAVSKFNPQTGRWDVLVTFKGQSVRLTEEQWLALPAVKGAMRQAVEQDQQRREEQAA